MDDRLKKAISWACFWMILVGIVFGMLIPWFVVTYGPTLFPKADFSGFENSMNTSSIIVSFASAVLGAFSIYQASASSKEMKNLLNQVNRLNAQQEEMNRMLQPLVHFGESTPGTGDWTADPGIIE